MAISNALEALDKLHKTVPGCTAFMAVEAVLAYGFLSLAIPSAHTWEWFLAVVFGLGALHNFLLLIQKIFYDIKAKRARQS